jgi:DNA modification methylase
MNYVRDCVTLTCGDGIAMLREWPDQSVDAIITDPPYGVGIGYDAFVDTRENVRALLAAFIPEAVRVAKVTLFPAGEFPTELWLYQTFPPRWRLCWYKGAQPGASFVGYQDWEAIMVYGKDVFRFAHDFFMANPGTPSVGGHPCPKPLAWARWLISRFTDEGGLVVDPFMGSGTVGAASVALGRRFIGAELSERYYGIAKGRIDLALDQHPMPMPIEPKAMRLWE